MTDETYHRIKVFLARQGVTPSASAPVRVDEDLEMDEPVLLTNPVEVVVSPSDFDDLRQRFKAEAREIGAI